MRHQLILLTKTTRTRAVATNTFSVNHRSHSPQIRIIKFKFNRWMIMGSSKCKSNYEGIHKKKMATQCKWQIRHNTRRSTTKTTTTSLNSIISISISHDHASSSNCNCSHCKIIKAIIIIISNTNNRCKKTKSIILSKESLLINTIIM